MELFGIKFVPLCVPLEQRLQALAAGAWFFVMIICASVTIYISLYIVLYTKYWLPMLLYLIWAWIIDRKTAEKGGRRYEWVRGLKWWQYLKDYFPAKLVFTPGVELDKTRNYVFCCFPHGIITISVLSAFGTTIGGFNKIFPYHTPYILALPINFYMPFTRELGLGVGGVSSSANSLNYLLSRPDGGNVAVLTCGGATESLNCRPGEYRLSLKNRKGFIKYALRHGSPLVPVFLFGENNLYNQVSNPKGSILRKIQENLRNLIGFAPVLPMGRGLFQYSFGLVPFNKPLTTVVGKPIDIVKIENPSREEIDELHERFVNSLINLFEDNKHKYVIDADKAKIIIE